MTGSTLHHVDVFATGPLTGNGLTVFLNTECWSQSMMQTLAQEMRQFESIFLSDITSNSATARVFTVEEELPFAGHPVLGAAAVLHRTQAPEAESCSWILTLPHGTIVVQSTSLGDHNRCEMNQGAPVFGGTMSLSALKPLLARLSLSEVDVVSGLPAQVISTGLPYLIIPIRPDALPRAAITGLDFEALLGTVGAKFVLVLEVDGREMRTWDNLGKVEDVATGSAAGPAVAYLLNAGLARPRMPIELAQGRFAGRPSKIQIVQDAEGSLLVSGEVWPISHGILDMNPSTTGH